MAKFSPNKARTLSPISGMLMNKPGQVGVPSRPNGGNALAPKIKAIGRGKKKFKGL